MIIHHPQQGYITYGSHEPCSVTDVLLIIRLETVDAGNDSKEDNSKAIACQEIPAD